VSAIGRDPDGFGLELAERTAAHELGLHRHLLVSERLRLRRRQLGLTQKEVVARLRRLGVDTTNKALSSLEHGAGLDVCKLPEIAHALDCTLTYLVGLSSDPLRWEPDGAGWPCGESRTGSGMESEMTGLPRAEPVTHASVSDPPPDEGRSQSSDGPWILGPVPDLRRQR
jgi:transcriptional regulator with XRE-family HTH domain